MSDNPTLYVELYCGYEHEGMRFGCTTREASRADLLAALDKEWYCMSGHHTVRRCTQTDPHEDFGCHWAVKP